MNIRLPLIVIVLVVIPTAVLSIIAARSLKADELIVKSRLQLAAENAARTAVDQIDSRLNDDLDHVLASMHDALAGGGEIARIRTTAQRLTQTRELASGVYLYMDPWGFLWPEQAADVAVGGENAGDEGDSAVAVQSRMVLDDALVTALRSRIAGQSDGDERIVFVLDKRYFMFAPVGGRKFYAGLEVDTPVLQQWMLKVISAGSGAGLQLSIMGEGVRLRPIGIPADPDVEVTDSLGDDIQVAELLPESEAPPLASLRLGEPFGAYSLSARALHDASVDAIGVWRSRLYTWTIVLLAMGIIAGVVLVMGQAALEIRRARSKSDFVVGVSHDLRTPVASVKMMAESLYMGHVADPDKQNLFLKTIIDQSDRLQQLVERVLFFVRFGQNALLYQKSKADLIALVRDTAQAFEDGARPTRLDDASEQPLVALDVLSEAVWVNADAQALQQVIFNLLDNARKYGLVQNDDDAALAGCRAIELSLREGGAGDVCVSVRDRGAGVRGSDLKRIFSRFYRAEDATDKNLSGVGLGLALCKHVVEAHGGRIRAENAEGGGLRVWFTLPRVHE